MEVEGGIEEGGGGGEVPAVAGEGHEAEGAVEECKYQLREESVLVSLLVG